MRRRPARSLLGRIPAEAGRVDREPERFGQLYRAAEVRHRRFGVSLRFGAAVRDALPLERVDDQIQTDPEAGVHLNLVHEVRAPVVVTSDPDDLTHLADSPGVKRKIFTVVPY